ncbi:MAG: hemolysin family protein [Roseburia sp.]|nr:hemolysin family protein [Roseburia sp.]
MEDGGSPYIGLVLFFLAALHMIFYGFLAALENQNENELIKREKDGDKRAKLLLKLMDRPISSVHTVQFILTGLNLCVGMFVLAGCGLKLKLIWFFAFWFCIVVLGIFLPAKIAPRNPFGWGKMAGLMRICIALSFPFVLLLEQITNLFAGILGVDPNENWDDVTEEEIISMVKEGHEQGVLMENEAEMIHNIFEFGDKEAKDIMTHRKNIFALDGTITFGEALDLMAESNNSRFPVYVDDIDNIIGVLHIKEALLFAKKPEYYGTPIKDIKDLVRNVDFIPETRNISLLFQEMQAEKNHMVIVVDEYGQTSGIVALEDIIEVIVGDILDEHDVEEKLIVQQFTGSYIMSGMADYEDVAKLLEFPEVEEEDSYETLNGFLISKIDKIPEDNDKISVNINGYAFKVLKIENKMIQKVLVTKLSESEIFRESLQEA